MMKVLLAVLNERRSWSNRETVRVNLHLDATVFWIRIWSYDGQSQCLSFHWCLFRSKPFVFWLHSCVLWSTHHHRPQSFNVCVCLFETNKINIWVLILMSCSGVMFSSNCRSNSCPSYRLLFCRKVFLDDSSHTSFFNKKSVEKCFCRLVYSCLLIRHVTWDGPRNSYHRVTRTPTGCLSQVFQIGIGNL